MKIRYKIRVFAMHNLTSHFKTLGFGLFCRSLGFIFFHTSVIKLIFLLLVGSVHLFVCCHHSSAMPLLSTLEKLKISYKTHLLTLEKLLPRQPDLLHNFGLQPSDGSSR